MPKELRTDDAEYALGLIERICDEVGPGVPCSPQERARAMLIEKEMEKILGAEHVTVEEFEIAPSGFLGWFRQGVVLAALALGCHFIAREQTGAPAIALSLGAFVLAALVLALATFQFALCKELIDPLLPKKGSLNIVGRIPVPGGGEAEQLLLFAGHHDSAHQATWARYFKYGYYLTIAFILWAVVAVAVRTGLYAAGLIFENADLAALGAIGLRTLLIPILPGLFFAFFFVGSGKNGGQVPGAADNLSGCALTLAMGRILQRHPELIPDRTEVRLITFGSEEAGMRGAMRYVERHLDELRAKHAKLLNIETVVHPVVNIMRSDCNGLVKSSPEMVRSLVRAAEQAGVPYRVRAFPFGGGGTDAYPFTKAGLQAACVLPLLYPSQMIQFYHQPSDNCDVLSIEPFENTLAVAVEWTRDRTLPGASD